MRLAMLGDHEPVRETLARLGTSPYAVWSESGGPPDSALTFAAEFAGAEAAIGEASQWTRLAYDFMDPWRGQLFGNIAWHGPTEVYMAAVAPLAGHADQVDALLHTALELADAMPSPPLQMYARVFGSCGLRLRDRDGDRDRAARLLDEAIALGDGMGAGFARAAAAHFPALRG
jgi:hypothetical protein